VSSSVPTPEVADPRPRCVGGLVVGVRCSECAAPSAWVVGRCPRCLGQVVPASFGPIGTVWSSADVHVAVGEYTPTYTLAYVDLDGVDGVGPRVLAHLRPGGEVPPGTRVEIDGDDGGDLWVVPTGTGA